MRIPGIEFSGKGKYKWVLNTGAEDALFFTNSPLNGERALYMRTICKDLTVATMKAQPVYADFIYARTGKSAVKAAFGAAVYFIKEMEL